MTLDFMTIFKVIDKLVFKPCGVMLSGITAEAESQEYTAHNFRLDNRNVKFRTAKITPTKTGQFVSIWKRNQKGITEPYAVSDDIDFFIIATQKEKNLGIFIFSKEVLHQNRILSDATRDGKRGVRVYPTWDLTTNKQAQQTQLWQTACFLNLSDEENIDLARARSLLNTKEI